MNWIRIRTAYLQYANACERSGIVLGTIKNNQINAFYSQSIPLSEELRQAMARKECARPGWKTLQGKRS